MFYGCTIYSHTWQIIFILTGKEPGAWSKPHSWCESQSTLQNLKYLRAPSVSPGPRFFPEPLSPCSLQVLAGMTVLFSLTLDNANVGCNSVLFCFSLSFLCITINTRKCVAFVLWYRGSGNDRHHIPQDNQLKPNSKCAYFYDHVTFLANRIQKLPSD